MIQRVQSIYLFLSVVAVSLMLYSPIALFELTDGSTMRLLVHQVKKINAGETIKVFSTWPVVLLIVVTCAMNMYAIFLFTRRVIQMRLAVYSMLLMAGIPILIFYFYMYVTRSYDIIGHHLRFTAILPIVGFLFNLLAFRAIKRDELIVRSYERLRR